jgi:hypothetical protein
LDALALDAEVYLGIANTVAAAAADLITCRLLTITYKPH